MKPILFLVLFFLASPTMAAIEIHTFESTQQEADFNELMAELRCLVCQNQNLADSNAELALDLRREVYEMITSGSSKREIVDFMVARYGDFVLYRPPVQSNTALLWIGPFIIFAVGMLVTFIFARRHHLTSEDEINEGSE